MDEVQAGKIGREQLLEWTKILEQYRAGKASVDARAISAESWWKLRNSGEEDRQDGIARDGFRSRSGWLHNVVTNKHADAMEAYPEPVVLPREPGDRQEAQTLSAILPVILEQNQFEKTWSEAMWQKLKIGTGCYKVVWDGNKLGGLGDITVTRANLLNLFWEPGKSDIQQSRYVFQTELADRDLVEEAYPQCKGKLKGDIFTAKKFLYDDTVPTDGKVTVIEVYYHVGKILHYCKYVGDVVLYATENETDAPTRTVVQPGPDGQPVTLEVPAGRPMAETGLYDHGKYPFVLDPLFPVEGSPAGYGYVDLCKNPQTEIDLMRTALVKNTISGATPRYFVRQDGAINEAELLDVNKPVVHTTGNLGEDSMRVLDYTPLPANYVAMLQETVQELRETSGNTETASGSTSAGVTAASAIAALQEASGKGSRDSTKSGYRAYREIVGLCIELIRQFYDAPRQFRITGENGQEQFVSYDNAGLQPQAQGEISGVDMGYRVLEFDSPVQAQKQTAYTTMAQNELALQFYQLGFFNPQLADQTLMCLDMMEFRGKEDVVAKIRRMGTLYDQMQMLLQYAATLAQKAQDAGALAQLQSIAAGMGGQLAQGQPVEMPGGDEESGQSGAGGVAAGGRRMIRVECSPRALTLRVEGHAYRGKPGEDIVCAAASMLAYTAGYMLVQAEERGEARDVVTVYDSGTAQISARAANAACARRLERSFADICAGFRLLAKREPDAVRVKII